MPTIPKWKQSHRPFRITFSRRIKHSGLQKTNSCSRSAKLTGKLRRRSPRLAYYGRRCKNWRSRRPNPVQNRRWRRTVNRNTRAWRRKFTRRTGRRRKALILPWTRWERRWSGPFTTSRRMRPSTLRINGSNWPTSADYWSILRRGMWRRIPEIRIS